MRKPTICTGENKDGDQLRGNHEADHRFCFCYAGSEFLYFPNPKFQASSHLLWHLFTDQFGSDKFKDIIGFRKAPLKILFMWFMCVKKRKKTTVKKVFHLYKVTRMTTL